MSNVFGNKKEFYPKKLVLPKLEVKLLDIDRNSAVLILLE